MVIDIVSYDFVFASTGSYAFVLGRNIHTLPISYCEEQEKIYPNLYGFIIYNLSSEDAIVIRDKLEKYSRGLLT